MERCNTEKSRNTKELVVKQKGVSFDENREEYKPLNERIIVWL
jgi:hypothetical protein